MTNWSDKQGEYKKWGGIMAPLSNEGGKSDGKRDSSNTYCGGSNHCKHHSFKEKINQREEENSMDGKKKGILGMVAVVIAAVAAICAFLKWEK